MSAELNRVIRTQEKNQDVIFNHQTTIKEMMLVPTSAIDKLLDLHAESKYSSEGVYKVVADVLKSMELPDFKRIPRSVAQYKMYVREWEAAMQVSDGLSRAEMIEFMGKDAPEKAELHIYLVEKNMKFFPCESVMDEDGNPKGTLEEQRAFIDAAIKMHRGVHKVNGQDVRFY